MAARILAVMEMPMTAASALSLRPFAALDRPLEVVRQFTPNWFAATMGTGILAVVLAQLPGAGAWARQAGEGLWLFNIGLFALFSLLYAARWLLFFREARRIFGHPVASMFFGCIPMGLATLVNGLVLYGRAHWGDQAVALAEVLWRADVVLSLACGLAIPFAMFTRQSHSLEQMTAVWLLPIVAAEVAAASGGLIAPLLADAHDRLFVLVSGYILWGYSVPAALSILVVLLLRMILHRPPPAAMAATSWLALGPIGTAALGLLVLGAAAPGILAQNGLGELGPAVKAVGLVGALMLWGYGLWWMGLAILVTLRQLKLGLPFNLGWWGYTFPLGVFTAATLKLAALLPLAILTTLAQGLVLSLALIWLTVAARTAAGAWRGELFSAPCLKG
jgi:C4-dicarboxylate transporter/malic acid transport protein